MIRLDFIEVGIAEVAVCNLHMKETRFVEVRPDALDCLNLCAAETGTAEITVGQFTGPEDRICKISSGKGTVYHAAVFKNYMFKRNSAQIFFLKADAAETPVSDDIIFLSAFFCENRKIIAFFQMVADYRFYNILLHGNAFRFPVTYRKTGGVQDIKKENAKYVFTNFFIVQWNKTANLFLPCRGV